MSTKCFWGMLMLGICGFLLPNAAGQTPDTSRVDLGAPGKEHRILDALAGSWSVRVKFPVGPGKHMEGKASCEAAWVMDGRFLRQEYSSTFAGKPLTIVRYLGFDRHKGKFVEVQFESTHTDVMHNEGTLSADGRIITCFGTHVDAALGQEVKVRSITTLPEGDTFTLELIYGEGEGAKSVTLTHERQKEQ